MKKGEVLPVGISTKVSLPVIVLILLLIQ